MAFPVLETQANGAQTSNSASWTLTFPSGVQAGDLLLTFMGTDGAITLNSLSVGTWVIQDLDDGGPVSSMHFAKAVADGTETGNFTATLSASEQGIWQVIRVSGWEGTLGTSWTIGTSSDGSVEANTVAGSSAAPDPPENNMNAGLVEDNLWFALASNDGTPTYTAKDANYTYVTNSPASSGGAGGAGLAVSWRQLRAASANPGAYTLSATETWAALTVGIRPAIPAVPITNPAHLPFVPRGRSL